MHDIVLIESAKLTMDENIILVAILENMDASIAARGRNVVPPVAPVKCRTLIQRSAFPKWLELRRMSEQQLKEAATRYVNMSKQEWETMIPKFRDPDPITH